MIVVDTNVASELMRPAPNARVVAWMRAQHAGDLYTTSITVSEIAYRVERLTDGARKALLRATATQVFSAFADHVLAFDAGAAALYGAIVSSRERGGAPIDGFDAQIAAICRRHGATLATRNVKDFEQTGVDVIDPWSEAG
jgi:predicted nucleic acid-binding protein